MTYQGGEFSTSQLLEEIKHRAREEKVQTLADYEAIIDDLIEDKKRYGFLSENEDLEQVRANLKTSWPEVEKGLEHVSKLLI
ncbi:MAG TPA: hypothetical protein DCX32_03245 [Candidatus Moranbacteria bacterium]|nr:MAG: hypothetical protein UW87_C0003G0042 [Candidatus Moranbacteria bacterium GW2011_GWC2_45_10]KKT95015.1 MAG: hypothetical protein UW95_C0005G0002 [Parcubacteria group bacterium GW2011_GWC1_45_14]HAV11534.1 hypothetical protein [Candidatus Moranbacteria bacterium]